MSPQAEEGPALGRTVAHACVRAKSMQLCLTPPLFGLWSSELLCPWGPPGKKTGVDCHGLLQEIFPTQGLNPRLRPPALAGGFFTTSTTWEAHSDRWGPQEFDQKHGEWLAGEWTEELKTRRTSVRACRTAQRTW